jgi:regulator of sirC expression with transglutaminase-like and TPR domain
LRFAVIVATLVLSVIFCSTRKSREPFPGAVQAIPHADTISLETACRIIASHPPLEFGATDSGSAAAFFRTLDSTGEAIRLSPSFRRGASAARTAILDVVYKTWNIGFDSTDTSLETLLPDRVYRARKGSCLGVSLIILILAEKTGCPIYGVMLPGHFYCRYNDGKERVNIEPNRSGCNHDDAYYRERYRTAEMPWYNLADLSRPKVIGVLCYNLGTLCLRKRLVKPAVAYYRECLHLIKDYPEAMGNLAVAYARVGDREASMELFATMTAEHPDLPNLAVNYGSVAAAAKQYHKALTIFLTGLDRHPHDSLLYKRSLYCLGRLGANDDSAKIFEQRLKAFTATAQ